MSETVAAPEKQVPAPIKAILGQKVGMTQIYNPQGKIIPVTVVEAGPCRIAQVLTPEKHGYSAVQVSFGAAREKNVNKPDAGQFKKANIPVAHWLRELRTPNASSLQVGQVINVDVFSAGDYVDISGTNKGKGFAGAVKRHNFGGGPSTHGQSDRQRAPGSSGSNTYPGRVFKGKKFPGHLGSETTTVQHLEIVQVLPEKHILMVRGAIPGPNKSLVIIEQTVKRLKARVQQAEPVGKKGAKKDAPKAATAAKGKAK